MDVAKLAQNLINGGKQFLSLKNLANIQTNFAEPFARGASPIPVNQLPLIGGNFHPAAQNDNTRLSTGAGLATQAFLINQLLAPLKLGQFAAKTLGPNFANVADRALQGFRMGASLPVEAQNPKDLIASRIGQGVGGAGFAALPFPELISTSKIPLNTVGAGRLGFTTQDAFNPANALRALGITGAATGGGLAAKAYVQNRLGN